jgi:hypothetical protein
MTDASYLLLLDIRIDYGAATLLRLGYGAAGKAATQTLSRLVIGR